MSLNLADFIMSLNLAHFIMSLNLAEFIMSSYQACSVAITVDGEHVIKEGVPLYNICLTSVKTSLDEFGRKSY